MMNDFHTPVLLAESLNGLNVKPNGVYVDATFGGGGHSSAIMDKLIDGALIVFDQDQEAVKNTIKSDLRFKMICDNFRNLKEQLSLINICKIDGLIADLGVSSYQFTDNKRGFSIKYDANIDMRMDGTIKKDGVFVLNNYNRENLTRILKDHSDFKSPKFIVDSIIKYREKKSIQTTFDLKKIFLNRVPKAQENKFFARLFQAVRIEVNDEINALKDLLSQSLQLLRPQGRLVIISYHSAEDKIVKSFMKFGNFSNTLKTDFFGNQKRPFKLITKKPIAPSFLEIKANNKSRSAKLRICEKI